jgi:hypothetical protein
MNQPADLATWIRENSYAIAMAVVGAYELAPPGSGIDLSLGLAGDALVAMIDGERDPEQAVRKVLNVRDTRHWLIRWQSGDARVTATDLRHGDRTHTFPSV